MRVLLVVAVLALALLVSAEPLQTKFDALKKKLGPQKPSLGSRRPSSGSASGSGSGSGSSSGQGKPELMAKEIIAVFGDADGSAFFKGNKILPDSVAEVPPRKASKSQSSSSIRKSGSSGSASKHRFRAPFMDDLKKKLGPKKLGSQRPTSHRSGSRGSSSNPRHRRPLFNFNTVPKGVTGVGLRKHNFGAKHHNLLVRFCNKHAKITTVIVVDKFVNSNGRPSKQGSSARRRGNKQSDLNIKGLAHKNLFVFNDRAEQVFPKKGSQSDSKKGSSSKGTAPPRPLSGPIAPPPVKGSPPPQGGPNPPGGIKL